MKHKHTLTRSATGLLVVDVQEKFEPVIPGFNDIVGNITKLILCFQMYKMPILVTEQYPKGLGNTVETLRRQFSFLEVVEKMEFACTARPEFVRQLTALNLEAIVVCGIETHVCVNQTVLGLIRLGYRVHPISDAVGSRRPIDHETALAKMHQAGAIPATTEMCLFELTEKAGTQSFKNIQRMVKSRVKTLPPRKPEKPVASAQADAPAQAPKGQSGGDADAGTTRPPETGGGKKPSDFQPMPAPGYPGPTDAVLSKSGPESPDDSASDTGQAEADTAVDNEIPPSPTATADAAQPDLDLSQSNPTMETHAASTEPPPAPEEKPSPQAQPQPQPEPEKETAEASEPSLQSGDADTIDDVLQALESAEDSDAANASSSEESGNGDDTDMDALLSELDQGSSSDDDIDFDGLKNLLDGDDQNDT